MATRTLLTVQDYAALDEPPGVRYELSEGELIVTPSASYFHNTVRDNLHDPLRAFVGKHKLGGVTSETDLILVGEVVRRPDVVFIRAERLTGMDLDQSPFPVAPDLAIEIVSKNDRADDLMIKVSQYLRAGAEAVWLLYPKTHVADRYVPGKLEPEVFSAKAGHKFEEPELLPGFSLSLSDILG
ncbi:MAG: Uma2 family endonuclease [Terriglobia bacterium]